VWLLNATSDARVALSAERRSYHVVLRDCMGDVTEETDISVNGIALLNIPRSGSARLTEK